METRRKGNKKGERGKKVLRKGCKEREEDITKGQEKDINTGKDASEERYQGKN